MQPSDFERFHAVMTGLAELHQRELSDFLLDAYWLALRDWTLADFEGAAAHLMQTMTWMPKPSDFTQLRRAGELTAGEAWDIVLSGAALEPGSRTERAARICGGQATIRHADTERALPHIQRRFLDIYAELSDVDPVREKLPQIAQPAARVALRGPAPIAAALQNLNRTEPPSAPGAPAARPAAKPAAKSPPKPAREKVMALLDVGGFTDEDIARVSGETVDFVREVRGSREVAA